MLFIVRPATTEFHSTGSHSSPPCLHPIGNILQIAAESHTINNRDSIQSSVLEVESMGFWDSIADAFARDGAVTTFCEKIPVVGHVTAGIQALSGNPEHAKRALATSTGSLVTTAGAVGGFFAGGPPGAILGAAAASAAGVGAEYAISTTINDKNVKGIVGDVSAGRFLTDAALGALGGGVPGGATTAVGKELTEVFGKSLGQEVTKLVTKTVGTKVATAVMIGVATAASQGLKGTAPTVGKVIPGAGDEPAPDVDSDTEKEKKKKIRVITAGQASQAKHLTELGTEVSNAYKVSKIGDLLLNLTQCTSCIVENAEWQWLNDGYNENYTVYQSKRQLNRDKAVKELQAIGRSLFEDELDAKLNAIDAAAKELKYRMAAEIKWTYTGAKAF
ncbi:MAG: hypothetical protein Q9208_007989 [Pyrenodesmia sp. 3 TL-2023]